MVTDTSAFALIHYRTAGEEGGRGGEGKGERGGGRGEGERGRGRGEGGGVRGGDEGKKQVS